MPHSRPLGKLERLLWLASSRLQCNFALTVLLEGEITLPALQAALLQVARRHPLFACRIEPHVWTVDRLTSADVPLPTASQFPRTDGQSWIGQVSAELAQPFPLERGPMLRYGLHTADGQSEITLTCSHVCADGMSTVFLMRDTLAALAHPTATVTPLPVFPPLDGLTPKGVQTNGSSVPAVQRMGRARQPDEIDGRPVQHLVWTLPTQESEELVKRCRAEQTTVHAALSAAFLRVFGERQPSQPVFRLQTPLNLRPELLPSVEDSIGLYVGTCVQEMGCDPQIPFWKFAQCFQHELQHQLQNRHWLKQFKKVRQISLLPRFLLRRLLTSVRGGANFDLSLTNLGRIPLPLEWPDAPFKLIGCHGPSVTPMRLRHRILGVGMIAGKQHFSLTGYDRDDLEQLRDGGMAQISAALS